MAKFLLTCELEHRCEGWFPSRQDYDRQFEAGQVRCPVCDSPDIRRLSLSPVLAMASGRSDQAESGLGSTSQAGDLAQTEEQGRLLALQAKILQAALRIKAQIQSDPEAFDLGNQQLH